MPYSVLFHSDLPEAATRPLVRTLESLPLSVTRTGTTDAEDARIVRRQEVPVVTLASCPSRLEALSKLGPRAWIAILPASEGSEDRFAEAGASIVLRLPLERSMLLSAVSRCLSAFGTAGAGGAYAPGAFRMRETTHGPGSRAD